MSLENVMLQLLDGLPIIGIDVMSERGLPMEHLIEQNPHSPNVDRFIMTRAKNHLWTKIVWSPTEGVPDALLIVGPSEVCDLKSSSIDENVLWFDVSVNDWRVLAMEVGKGLDNILNVVYADLFVLGFLALNPLIEVALLCILHKHKDISFVLKYLVESNYVGMRAFGEYLDLFLKLI